MEFRLSLWLEWALHLIRLVGIFETGPYLVIWFILHRMLVLGPYVLDLFAGAAGGELLPLFFVILFVILFIEYGIDTSRLITFWICLALGCERRFKWIGLSGFQKLGHAVRVVDFAIFLRNPNRFERLVNLTKDWFWKWTSGSIERQIRSLLAEIESFARCRSIKSLRTGAINIFNMESLTWIGDTTPLSCSLLWFRSFCHNVVWRVLRISSPQKLLLEWLGPRSFDVAGL